MLGEADDVRGEADVSLTLVQGSRPVAHGSLSLPLPKEGFYWKDWQPGLAARTALGADIYAITVEFHYWGGSGMGQLGSRNDVIYLFARRGNRFALMMGAHVRSHDFDYSDCADDDDACFARPQGHEDPPQHYRLMAATAAAVSGERPRFELSDGEARMTSRWDEAAGRYDPHLLTW